MNQTGVGDAIVQEITIKATVERNFEALTGWDLEERDGITPVRLTHSGFTSESSRATYRAGLRS